MIWLTHACIYTAPGVIFNKSPNGPHYSLQDLKQKKENENNKKNN